MKTWDDIQSLDLGIDYNYQDTLDKRVHGRMTQNDVLKLISDDTYIKVQVYVEQSIYQGILLDISAGGIFLSLPILPMLNDVITVKCLFSNKNITTRGRVKHIKTLKNSYNVGVMFIDLPENIKDFLRSLYVEKVARFGK
ncbi:PilZ domain-containing protein [Candidatus Dojkabacteria bacterium]|jgi:hypothetical protein|nr:PilZ domain-containing protein [Candidatus Dojkabacteria bacterium]